MINYLIVFKLITMRKKKLKHKTLSVIDKWPASTFPYSFVCYCLFHLYFNVVWHSQQTKQKWTTTNYKNICKIMFFPALYHQPDPLCRTGWARISWSSRQYGISRDAGKWRATWANGPQSKNTHTHMEIDSHRTKMWSQQLFCIRDEVFLKSQKHTV